MDSLAVARMAQTTDSLRVAPITAPSSKVPARRLTGIHALLAHVGSHSIERREAERRARETAAPDFNVFQFLRSDEYGLSAVIAWLLDPRGSHGHKDQFLKLFFRAFGLALKAGTESATVATEALTDRIAAARRRIDVLVRIGGYRLAIENKPWAPWQAGQVRAYLEQIAREAADGHCLVLIKGTPGTLPEDQLSKTEREKRSGEGTLIDGDYGQLGTWLADCAAACRAPRVRYFIEEFATMVSIWFGASRATDAHTNLARHLAQGDNLPAALDVIAAGDAVLRELAVICRKLIEPRLLPGWRLLDETPDPLARASGFRIDFEEIAPFTFDVGFDALRFGQPYYGLQLKDGSDVSAPYPALRARLIEKDLRAAQTHAWWIWWTYADESESRVHPGDPADVWRAFTDGRWADFLMVKATEFHRRLTEVGALPWQRPPRFRRS
jgi:hypothetical protein